MASSSRMLAESDRHDVAGDARWWRRSTDDPSVLLRASECKTPSTGPVVRSSGRPGFRVARS
jgi:hypothetical protein